MRERGAARKAKVHVEAQDVRVVGKHLQDHRAAGRATCHLRNARDPGDRRFDKLRRRGRVIERGFKPQHAAVGGDQHEVRRVLFQLVRVSLTPRLRLLIFRDGDVEQDSEPDRVPIRASERCETVLADRIKRRMRTRPYLRASAAKLAGADFRMPEIFRPSRRRSASPQPACASDCRNFSACSGSAGSETSLSRSFAGGRGSHGSACRGIFTGALADTKNHLTGALGDQLDELAHLCNLFNLVETELNIEFDAADQPDMRQAVQAFRSFCLVSSPITRSSLSSSARNTS
jgi:hypothetical protein